MAKRAKEPAPESGIVKVVDPLYDAPVAVDVPEPPAPSGSTVGQRLRRFFELLLRLISWVIIFTVFGAALYYSVPLLYQRFVKPVEQNTVQVAELQAQQKQIEERLAALQEQVATQETEQRHNSQSLSELDERISQLETGIDSHTKSLAALEKIQSELQEQDELTSAELERQIDLLKSVEMLSRARLYMYQSNFGLAKADVQRARDLLIDLQPTAGKTLAEDLDAVIYRLDLVLSNLPNFPVAASDDLDIAWQILITGVPPVDTAATAVPAGSLSQTPESTITATLEPTPTP
jgi:Tfp pilus assembly protein PilE